MFSSFELIFFPPDLMNSKLSLFPPRTLFPLGFTFSLVSQSPSVSLPIFYPAHWQPQQELASRKVSSRMAAQHCCISEGKREGGREEGREEGRGVCVSWPMLELLVIPLELHSLWTLTEATFVTHLH